MSSPTSPYTNEQAAGLRPLPAETGRSRGFSCRLAGQGITEQPDKPVHQRAGGRIGSVSGFQVTVGAKSLRPAIVRC